MEVIICNWCLDDYKGEVFFKTKNKHCFKCPYHSKKYNLKEKFYKLNKEEIEKASIQYIKYFEKTDISKEEFNNIKKLLV